MRRFSLVKVEITSSFYSSNQVITQSNHTLRFSFSYFYLISERMPLELFIITPFAEGYLSQSLPWVSKWNTPFSSSNFNLIHIEYPSLFTESSEKSTDLSFSIFVNLFSSDLVSVYVFVYSHFHTSQRNKHNVRFWCSTLGSIFYLIRWSIFYTEPLVNNSSRRL